MAKDKNQAIVVKRVVKGGHGHHGGAWKLAYADFMTAMMAFFLLMWLLSSSSPATLKGIAEYFSMPLKVALQGGDRSALASSIIQGGGRDITTTVDGVTRMSEGDTPKGARATKGEDLAKSVAQAMMDRKEQERLHDLQIKLMAAIEANPVLRQFKQQIRIDSTLTGLRIEIVDSQKRPMFATASDAVEPYMRDILREIGHTLNDVPNHIVVQGHTDAVAYAGNGKGYSNWELSSDRANASRRELIEGGMDDAKVLRVLGLASAQNLNKADPLDPENRRISIIVLNKRSEDALMRDDSVSQTLSNDAAGINALSNRMATPAGKWKGATAAAPSAAAPAASAGPVINAMPPIIGAPTHPAGTAKP